jgi:GNAT superfamily N-acetyltransferase
MYCLRKEEMNKIAPFFDGWNETLIWSCLQGYMGKAWADDIQNPNSVQVYTADFCFYAGDPKIELVKNIPDDFKEKYIFMVPLTKEWADLIEQVYAGRFSSFMRYAIKKEPEVFDRTILQAYIEKLPANFRLRRIDEEIYHRVLTEEWSKYFCCNFPTYEFYDTYGLGYVILDQDRIVSGASSYTVYDKGIEIEIDTREEYRRKGLALACASALILECLNKGIYPSWDAANRESVALSEKLGYHFEKEYITYAIKNFSE